MLVACVDGLKGFPEAIEATFPQAWVQTCIVHLIGTSLRYVNYRDGTKVASGRRRIYGAATAEQAQSRSPGPLADDVRGVERAPERRFRCRSHAGSLRERADI